MASASTFENSSPLIGNSNNNNNVFIGEDERLDRAVKIVRQMSSANLKEQCLRTEWAALQTDLERDLLCQVVAERAFWEDVKETANEDLQESSAADTGGAGEDEVDVDQRMLQMFKIFDKDGSGSIDSNELHQMLLYMGVPLSDGEVREMIAMVDSDQDGAINQREFLHVMKNILPQKTQQPGAGSSGGGGNNNSSTSTSSSMRGPSTAASLTAANLANAQRNADAQNDIRAANTERDELASRASEAAQDD